MKILKEEIQLNKTFLSKRPRRNRKTPAIRKLIEETHLSRSDFVIPLFFMEGYGLRESQHGLEGIVKLSFDQLVKEVSMWAKRGFRAFALFPVIASSHKDKTASFATDSSSFFLKGLKELKHLFPELCFIVDVALDPFTSHGHDGLLSENGYILNDATLKALADMSLAYAEAGVDVIAPSDMMDGRVAYLRERLDFVGFTQVSILSYAAKYASSLYGPFRAAVESPLAAGGDKFSYQLNPANKKEAFLEAYLDEQEGADMIMVKPALSYLDILEQVACKTSLPLAAYHVSGEYAMVMAAHEKGYLDKDKVFIEHCLSIKRAGADFIFSYAYQEVDQYISLNE